MPSNKWRSATSIDIRTKVESIARIFAGFGDQHLVNDFNILPLSIVGTLFDPPTCRTFFPIFIMLRLKRVQYDKRDFVDALVSPRLDTFLEELREIYEHLDNDGHNLKTTPLD